MRIQLEVELEDRPGELVHVLEEVARFGGNLESVFHERARGRANRVPVRLAFDMARENVAPLVEALRRRARVTQVEGARVGVPASFLVVGHLFQTGTIVDAGAAVFEEGATLTRVQADVESEEAPSSALIEVQAPDETVKRRVEARLAKLAKDRDLLFLSSLEVE